MARRKKKFECNHKGFGKYCHRCDNEKNHPKAVTKPAVDANAVAAVATEVAEKRKKAERTLCPKCKSFKITKRDFTELADMSKKEFVCRECKHEFDDPGSQAPPGA